MRKNGIILPIITAAGVVLGTAARMLGIARTDMKTGLLNHDSTLLCNLLYYGAILLTAVCAALVAGFGENGGLRKAKASDIVDGKAIAFGAGLLLIALCAAYEGISQFDQLGGNGSGGGLNPSVFLMIIDLAFALILGIIAFVTLYKKEFKPGLGFSYAFGGLYFVARGIYCFMNRMAIATFPEYLIEALSVVLGALFFVMAGKLLSGNEGRLTKNFFCGWGAAVSAMTLSSAIATGLAKLFFSEEISLRIVFSAAEAERNFQFLHGIDAYYLAFPPLVHIAVGVFAFAGICALCSAGSQND